MQQYKGAENKAAHSCVPLCGEGDHELGNGQPFSYQLEEVNELILQIDSTSHIPVNILEILLIPASKGQSRTLFIYNLATSTTAYPSCHRPKAPTPV